MKKLPVVCLTALLAVGSLFAADFSLGINIGPPPPPRVIRVQPRAPGPGYTWVGGYWYPNGGRYAWHDGYWSRPAYESAHWIGPRWESGRYYEGYWDGEHGRIGHDHRWDREHDRDWHRQ